MTAKPASIAVVLCSSRQPRANPQITQFVIDTINTTYQPTPNSSQPAYTLTTIDLASLNLPFLDEPGVPAQIHDPSQYAHEHTRAWSALVRSHAAFIFITPQYNWGYPAVLKNAIDYLFNEWAGKPALVVSYGGHGGGKCNAQLRQVLDGVRMVVARKNVELTFEGREQLGKAAAGKEMGLDGKSETGTWAKERGQIKEAFAEFMELVGKKE